jgi:hypothetical protein
MDAPPSLIVAIAMSRHRQNNTPTQDIFKEFREAADYHRRLAKEYENMIIYELIRDPNAKDTKNCSQ